MFYLNFCVNIIILMVGFMIGIINKKLLCLTIDKFCLKKNLLIQLSILRIIIVSIIFFFIIKYKYILSLPLFIGYLLSSVYGYYKTFKRSVK